MFTVGRFQVSPSQRGPPLHHQEASPRDQAATTTSLQLPSSKNQPESNTGSSTEGSQSENSNPTVTFSSAGVHDSLSGQEGKKSGSRRLSVSLWEGPGSSFSQSRSRSATYSSDESEGEEMWEELIELRQRWIEASVQIVFILFDSTNSQPMPSKGTLKGRFNQIVQ